MIPPYKIFNLGFPWMGKKIRSGICDSVNSINYHIVYHVITGHTNELFIIHCCA